MSVRAASKPFIVVNALAAGRLGRARSSGSSPRVRKPDDLVSIGMESVEELEETVGLAEKWLQ